MTGQKRTNRKTLKRFIRLKMILVSDLPELAPKLPQVGQTVNQVDNHKQ